KLEWEKFRIELGKGPKTEEEGQIHGPPEMGFFDRVQQGIIGLQSKWNEFYEPVRNFSRDVGQVMGETEQKIAQSNLFTKLGEAYQTFISDIKGSEEKPGLIAQLNESFGKLQTERFTDWIQGFKDLFTIPEGNPFEKILERIQTL